MTRLERVAVVGAGSWGHDSGLAHLPEQADRPVGARPGARRGDRVESYQRALSAGGGAGARAERHRIARGRRVHGRRSRDGRALARVPGRARAGGPARAPVDPDRQPHQGPRAGVEAAHDRGRRRASPRPPGGSADRPERRARGDRRPRGRGGDRNARPARGGGRSRRSSGRASSASTRAPTSWARSSPACSRTSS